MRRTKGCALVAWVAGFCVALVLELPEGLRLDPFCCLAMVLSLVLAVELPAAGTGKSLNLTFGMDSYEAMLDWKSSKLTGGRKLKELPLA